MANLQEEQNDSPTSNPPLPPGLPNITRMQSSSSNASCGSPPLPPTPSSSFGSPPTCKSSSKPMLTTQSSLETRVNRSMSAIGTEESKVLFMKPLPKNIIESTIRGTFEGFGPVETVIILRRPIMTQALVQMQNQDDARLIIAHYNKSNPLILEEESMDHTTMNEVEVSIEFSKSQELRANATTSSFSAGGGSSGTHYGGTNSSFRPRGYSRSMSVTQNHTGQRILLMTFQGFPQYAITTNLLAEIFTTYGKVEKIVVFNKTVGLQALLQFEEPHSALNAKSGMSSFNLLPNDDSCQVWINYSKLDTLTVRENGLRSRDFTNDNLPPPELDVPVEAFVNPPSVDQYGSDNIMGSRSRQNSNSSYMISQQQTATPQGSPVLLFTNLHEELVSCDMLFNLISCYGTVLKIRKLYTKPGHALVQMESYHVALRVMGHLRGFQLFHLPLEIQESKHYYISYHHHRTSRATLDNITEETQAGADEHDLNESMKLFYQDYTRKENRFTGKFMASSRYMTNPTPVLHVSNLTLDASERDIATHFEHYVNMFVIAASASGDADSNAKSDQEVVPSETSSNGQSRREVVEIKKFDRNEHAQALLRFETVEDATDMLALAHNSMLNGKKLKIAFSTHSMDTSLAGLSLSSSSGSGSFSGRRTSSVESSSGGAHYLYHQSSMESNAK